MKVRFHLGFIQIDLSPGCEERSLFLCKVAAKDFLSNLIIEETLKVGSLAINSLLFDIVLYMVQCDSVLLWLRAKSNSLRGI
jgi:hypothetical protein